MPDQLYCAYGFRIRSEIPLPGAIMLDDDGLSVDIAIVLGSAQLESVYERRGGFAWGAAGLLFSSAGNADFLISPDHIIVEPKAMADLADICARLVSTALPVAVSIRGKDVVLHAAGLVPPGREDCIAVCGVSGAGKSSVLMAALRDGASIVGDDTLRLDGGDPAVVASGLPTLIFHGGQGRYRQTHAAEFTRIRRSAPLRAIVILALPRQSGDEYGFERLSSRQAFGAILAQLHRPNAVALMRRQRHIMANLLSVAKREIHVWRRREGELTLGPDELDQLYRLGLSAAARRDDPN